MKDVTKVAELIDFLSAEIECRAESTAVLGDSPPNRPQFDDVWKHFCPHCNGKRLHWIGATFTRIEGERVPLAQFYKCDRCGWLVRMTKHGGD